MLPHQLTRLARHCAVGLSLVGGHGVGSNHSGDIILAISTANRTDEITTVSRGATGIVPVEKISIEIIKNESMDMMFRAASEATEEAILNSIVAGRARRTGFEGRRLDGLPVEKVKEILQRYLVEV
jgi:D-aminopeptidase